MSDERKPITMWQRLSRWWWGVYLMEATNRRIERHRRRAGSGPR